MIIGNWQNTTWKIQWALDKWKDKKGNETTDKSVYVVEMKNGLWKRWKALNWGNVTE